MEEDKRDERNTIGEYADFHTNGGVILPILFVAAFIVVAVIIKCCL